MITKSAPPSYLEAREAFLRAMAHYRNHENALRLLLGASDTGADLEARMLEARSNGLHRETIAKLHSLGVVLDRASDALDLATELQRRRVATQQAAFDASFRQLEC